MDPVILLTAIKSWSAIAVIVVSVLVTAASFLLKLIASYINSMKENIPTYNPSKGLIILMAILSAISQNSPAATHILMTAKMRSKEPVFA